MKSARRRGRCRRLDGRGAGRGNDVEAGFGQPAGNVATEKAARAGDQHAHGA
jgi:hypothetical protein